MTDAGKIKASLQKASSYRSWRY